MSVVPAPSHAASPSLAGGVADADDSVGAVSLLDASDPMASANQEVLEEAGSDYVPAHEEIVEYARWLGIRPDEDASMLWIAKEGLAASLPADWKPCRTGDGQVYYFNFATGESDWDHPCDGIYRSKVEEARAKRDAARADASGSSFVSPDASADVSAGARDSLGAASLRDSRDGAPLTHRSDGSSRRSSLAGGARSASPRPPAARGTPSPRPVGGPVPRVARSPLAALDQNTLGGARNDPKRAAVRASGEARETASSARAKPNVGGASSRSEASAPAPAPALDHDHGRLDLDRSGASDRSDGSGRSSRRGRFAMLPSRGEPSRPKPSLALNLEGVGGGAANDVDASADASEIMVESFSMDESLDESSDRSVASARSGRSSRGVAAAMAARTGPTPAADDEDDTPDASAFIVGGGFDSPPESPGLGAATKDRSLGSRNDPAAGISAPLASTRAFGDGVGTGAAERSFPSLDLDDDPEPERDEGGDALGLGATRASERSVPSLVLDDEEDESEGPPRATTATTGTTRTTLTTSTSSASGRSTFRATARSTADSDKAEALSMLLASDDDEEHPGEAEYSAEWDEDDAEDAGSNPAEVDLGGRVKMSAGGKFKPLRAPQTTTAVEEQKTTTASAAAAEAEARTTSAAAAEELPRRARGSRMLRDAMNFSRDSDDSQSPSPSPSPRAEEEKTRRADETAAERDAAAMAADAATARAERAERAAAEAAETAASLRRQLEEARDALERERRRAEAEVAEERARKSRDAAVAAGAAENAEKTENAEANAAAANAARAAANAAAADAAASESRASEIARATAALTAAFETGTAAHEKALRAEVATFERAAKALVDRAERAATAADRAASAADRAADRASESAARGPARPASPSIANERRRAVSASPAASPAASPSAPAALGASLQLAAERATGDSPGARSPGVASPRAYSPGSSRTPSRRVPTPPETRASASPGASSGSPLVDDPMETLTDVSSSLDDSLSPRGFGFGAGVGSDGRRASSGSAGGRVGIRGRNLKPQPPRGPCPSDVSSDLGSSFGSGSSSVAAPDSGGGGDAVAGAIRSRRHVKGDARAAARASRHDAQVHGEGSPVTATRVVSGAGAKASSYAFSFAPRPFRPGHESSRPDFDAVAGGTNSAPDGTLRGIPHGISHGTHHDTGPGTSGFVSAGASAAAEAARRAVATGEALVAKLERQRAAREVASKTARGSGSAAAAFDAASRKLEEWLDRERRSLGSFRRVAAILG